VDSTERNYAYLARTPSRTQRSAVSAANPGSTTASKEGCEDLGKPVIYCGLCRQILRAKELARRKGEEIRVPPVALEKRLYYSYKTYEHTLDRCTLIRDDEELGDLGDFVPEACTYVRSVGRWADVKRIKTWLNNREHKHTACNVAGE
jgi:hypothetical protein